MTKVRSLGEIVSIARLWGSCILVALGVGAVAAAPAMAQVVVGGGKPSVEVDTSVLDHLGNEPTLPDLFLGRHAMAQPATAATPVVTHTAQPAVRLPADPPPVKLHRPVHWREKYGHEKYRHEKYRHALRRSHKTRVTKAVLPPKAAGATTSSATSSKAAEPHPQEVAKTGASESPAVQPVTAVTAAPLAAEAPKPASEAKAASDTLPKAEPSAAPVAVAVPDPAPAPAPMAATAAAAVAVEPAAPPAAATAPAAAAPLMPAVNLPAVPPIPTEEPPAAEPQASPAPAVEPSAAIIAGETLSAISFDRESAHLPEAAHNTLMALAGRLATDPNLEIQLLAYAQGDEDQAGQARRLSLSRALAVRSFLIERGVRSTRIEVRAMGNKVPEGPADRVDVVVLKR